MVLIKEYTSRAGCFFSRASAAAVHSSYLHTVNLEVEGELFSLQSAHLTKTPLALTVDDDTWLIGGFQRGQPVQIHDGLLEIGALTLSMRSATAWNPSFRARTRTAGQSGRFLAGAIKQVLLNTEKDSAFLDVVHPERARTATGMIDAREVAAAGMRGFWHSMKTGELENAAASAAQLTGLGSGLTPAGDDFNVGILAHLCDLECAPEHDSQNRCRAEALREALAKQIHTRLDQTSDLSAAFLNRACDGEFSEMLHMLYAASSAEEAANAAWGIEGVGHSSGVDTLCGIYAAATLL